MRTHTRPLRSALAGVLASFTMLGGCGGSQGPAKMVHATEPSRPPWTSEVPPARDELSFYVGRGLASPSPDLAASRAWSDALAQVAQESGAEVVAAFSQDDQSSGENAGFGARVALPPTPWTAALPPMELGAQGSYWHSSQEATFRVSGRTAPVKVRGLRAMARYDEEWQRGDQPSYDSWVLVSVPSAARDRLLGKSNGLVLVVSCKAEPSADCDRAVEASVRGAAPDRNITLVGDSAVPDREQGFSTAASMNADGVLVVSASLEPSGEMSGVHLVNAAATFEILDAKTRLTRDAGRVGPVKVKGTTGPEALVRARDVLAEQLGASIGE